MIRSRWPLLLKAALTFALLGAVISYIDLDDVWQRVRSADPLLLAGAVALMAGGYVLCGIRWAWMAEGLGIEVSPSRKVRLYFLGMFASLFLPSTIGGDVVRAVLLAKSEGRTSMAVPAAASVVLDRINGLYALVLLISVCMLAFSWPTEFWIVWILMAGGMWLLLLLIPWLWQRLPARLSRFQELPLATPRFRRMWWRSLPVSMLFQIMVVQTHVLLGMAVGLDMSWAAFAVMVGLVALVSILPVSLNGFGLREAGYVGLASWLGADASAAAAMAALWVIVLAIASLPGLWVIWRLGGIRRLGRAQQDGAG